MNLRFFGKDFAFFCNDFTSLLEIYHFSAVRKLFSQKTFHFSAKLFIFLQRNEKEVIKCPK